MKANTPYISLNGKAEEALNFYQGVFGGTVELIRYKDMPAGGVEEAAFMDKEDGFQAFLPEGGREADRVRAKALMEQADQLTEHIKNKVLHGMLTCSNFALIISDSGAKEAPQSGVVSIAAEPENEEELNRVWNLLKEKGAVGSGLHTPFWGGRFGMLVDRYNVYWLFNLPAKK